MIWKLPDDPFDMSEWAVPEFSWVDYYNNLCKRSLPGPARYAVGLALFKRMDELQAEGKLDDLSWFPEVPE